MTSWTFASSLLFFAAFVPMGCTLSNSGPFVVICCWSQIPRPERVLRPLPSPTWHRNPSWWWLLFYDVFPICICANITLAYSSTRRGYDTSECTVILHSTFKP
jgi:hypothetical protein